MLDPQRAVAYSRINRTVFFAYFVFVVGLDDCLITSVDI